MGCAGRFLDAVGGTSGQCQSTGVRIRSNKHYSSKRATPSETSCVEVGRKINVRNEAPGDKYKHSINDNPVFKTTHPRSRTPTGTPAIAPPYTISSCSLSSCQNFPILSQLCDVKLFTNELRRRRFGSEKFGSKSCRTRLVTYSPTGVLVPTLTHELSYGTNTGTGEHLAVT